jgi:hypothetical protein
LYNGPIPFYKAANFYHSIPCNKRNPHPQSIQLTNNQRHILRELVLWNFEVQWRGSLSYTAGDIVVGTVTGAEPSSEITSFADGYTSQVCADTCIFSLTLWHYERMKIPLGLGKPALVVTYQP